MRLRRAALIRSRCPLLEAEPADVSISETVDEVIVDHADRLHVRIDHGRSDEAEPAALEIAAECVGLAGRGWKLAQGSPSILPWPAIDELPTIRIEAFEFFLHGKKRACVVYRRGDLHPIPDDRRIGGQLVDSRLGESRHFLRIEVAECAAVAFAFLEHNRPAESRLRCFENQELEMSTVIVRWHTPFVIVIFEHQGIVDVDPGATFRFWHGSLLHDTPAC